MFGFLSAWFVVVFSVERFIAVYFPIRRLGICSSARNKSSIIMIIILAFLLYSFALITSGLETQGSFLACVPLKSWFVYVRYMAFGKF